mmetsp:Transcript_12428/g.18679  ORF Transcript_12428/g.18679 Transcript_12428/m.18679 type:complete len:327 (-) Transcript_12428:34-1014(-)
MMDDVSQSSPHSRKALTYSRSSTRHKRKVKASKRVSNTKAFVYGTLYEPFYPPSKIMTTAKFNNTSRVGIFMLSPWFLTLLLIAVGTTCSRNLFTNAFHLASPTNISWKKIPSNHPTYDTSLTPISSSGYASTSNSMTKTALGMGLFDFLKSRDGDFVKLQSSDESVFGPGPLLILYNIPHGLLNEELNDMIEDGAPIATKSCESGVKFARIYSSDVVDDNATYGDMSVSQVLDTILQSIPDEKETSGKKVDLNAAPILYFSGISNAEMMQTYKIIGKEIFEESQGTMNAACAKVVGPALGKNFQQLVEEISGDHYDVINPQQVVA